MIDLGPYIGEIARKLVGEPNREQSRHHQLRFGRHGSVAVEIAGAKRGQWFDHENGVDGGPLEMLRTVGRLDDDEIADWLVLCFRNNVSMGIMLHHRFCSARCGRLARD
jgi:hypothetical protein